jgi:hypothetical protein
MDANAYTRPDRDCTQAARLDIDTTSDEVKDELLTDLLVQSYPSASTQHN